MLPYIFMYFIIKWKYNRAISVIDLTKILLY